MECMSSFLLFPSGQYYTGHILSGKSYKAEGLVNLSSLIYDIKCGLATWTNILIIF